MLQQLTGFQAPVKYPRISGTGVHDKHADFSISFIQLFKLWKMGTTNA